MRNFESSFKKDIDRQLHNKKVDNRRAKLQKEWLEERSTKSKERGSVQSDNRSRLSKETADRISKSNQRFAYIESQRQKREQDKIFAGVLKKGRNEVKQENNAANKAHEQQQLDAIKERVFKRHTYRTVRRKKQMDECMPPTTYEIYMQRHARIAAVAAATTQSTKGAALSNMLSSTGMSLGKP